MKKSRLHQEAIAILDAEIARCENHSEYSERSKVEAFVRSKMLLLAKRREANANGHTNGAEKGASR